ncbi:MAG: dethiobiotin synthase [Limisphaerales bacterium]
MKQTLFITGTDTGVGKTVLTALLTGFLRESGVNAAALKPICSGGRDDARTLHAAMNGALTLDEINPWHFRAAIAPSHAAKLESKSVSLAEVVAHSRALQKRFDVLFVEGAGGLLSPLGENFDSRDLMVALRAMPIIVAQNKLGTLNHILLTLEALPKNLRAKAHIVLMSPPKPDASTKTNAILLADYFDAGRIVTLPWFGARFSLAKALKIPRVQLRLRTLTR